jgi:hypothetical protein
MWIQFFRPRATGRIEFSARLLLNSSSGFQESGKFLPKRESVVAGFAKYTGGQCNGLCCLDLAKDIIQERFGFVLTQSMTPSGTNYSAASFRVEGKQFIHPRHNRSCNRVSWI